MKLKALYLHGFASGFDPMGGKIQDLKSYFDVVPYTYECDKPYPELLDDMKAFIKTHNISHVFGTSLGGFYAIQLASQMGVTSIALNPSVQPGVTLLKYLGANKNFKTGQEFQFTREVLESYPLECDEQGDVTIYVMEGDEILDSFNTQSLLSPHFTVHMRAGGNHRFEDLSEILPEIYNQIKPVTLFERMVNNFKLF